MEQKKIDEVMKLRNDFVDKLTEYYKIDRNQVCLVMMLRIGDEANGAVMGNKMRSIEMIAAAMNQNDELSDIMKTALKYEELNNWLPDDPNELNDIAETIAKGIIKAATSDGDSSSGLPEA